MFCFYTSRHSAWLLLLNTLDSQIAIKPPGATSLLCGRAGVESNKAELSGNTVTGASIYILAADCRDIGVICYSGPAGGSATPSLQYSGALATVLCGAEVGTGLRMGRIGHWWYKDSGGGREGGCLHCLDTPAAAPLNTTIMFHTAVGLIL